MIPTKVTYERANKVGKAPQQPHDTTKPDRLYNLFPEGYDYAIRYVNKASRHLQTGNIC